MRTRELTRTKYNRTAAGALVRSLHRQVGVSDTLGAVQTLRVQGECVLINIAKGMGILLSLFAVIASPAAFTPAVLLAFFLMAISGLAGWLGHLKWAIAMLAISSVAVGISPVTDQFGHSILLAVLYLVPVVLGYGGVLLGVHKVQTRQIT